MQKLTLRALRTNANLTQPEAAKQLGVSLATMINYESGRRFPNAITIQKICDLYNCKFEEINFLN